MEKLISNKKKKNIKIEETSSQLKYYNITNGQCRQFIVNKCSYNDFFLKYNSVPFDRIYYFNKKTPGSNRKCIMQTGRTSISKNVYGGP